MLEAAGQRFLIDYGMEQGKNVYENQPLPVAPGEIDFVLITMPISTIPVFCRCWRTMASGAGSTPPSPQWSSAASCCGTRRIFRSLKPSGKPQGQARRRRAGGAHVHHTGCRSRLPLVPGCGVQQAYRACPGHRGTVRGRGAPAGSASIELWITEGSTTTKLVFSGDIGNLEQPIIKDPTYIQQADYVFMESTYVTATTPHGRTMWQNWQKFCSAPLTGAATWWCPALRWAARRRCCIFCGRSRKKPCQRTRQLPGLHRQPAGHRATRIFRDTDPDCFDAQTRALLEKGIDPSTCRAAHQRDQR